MPKEKKSAWAAISPATSAARGTSIMVPISASIDEEGVGKLMAMAVELGRGARPGMEIGICGEPGGDPKSIAFCHRIGLDYVSCSPFRVPIARLAAAHAALREQGFTPK